MTPREQFFVMLGMGGDPEVGEDLVVEDPTVGEALVGQDLVEDRAVETREHQEVNATTGEFATVAPRVRYRPSPAEGVHGRTAAVKRITKEEQRIGRLLYPNPKHPRPATRGDCCQLARPCPFVACRHHLMLDVNDAGSLKAAFPGREPWDHTPSCSLDVAEDGGCTLDEVGELLNITRERVRQIEIVALRKMTEAGAPSRLLLALADHVRGGRGVQTWTRPGGGP